MIHKIFSVSIIFLLSGCASDGGKSLLDRIEFDDDEYGCARVQGQVKMSGNPFAGADAQLLVVKKKDNPNPESDSPAPDC